MPWGISVGLVHLGGAQVHEDRPSGLVVLPGREEGPLDIAPETGGLLLLGRVDLIQSLEEEQERELLDHV